MLGPAAYLTGLYSPPARPSPRPAFRPPSASSPVPAPTSPRPPGAPSNPPRPRRASTPSQDAAYARSPSHSPKSRSPGSNSNSTSSNPAPTMNIFPEHHPHTHHPRPTSFYIEDILLNKPKQLQYARAELTAAAAAAAAAAAGAAALGPAGLHPATVGGGHHHRAAAGLAEYYTYLPGPTYLPHQPFTHPAFATHKHDHPFLLPAGAGELYLLLFLKIIFLIFFSDKLFNEKIPGICCIHV